jgi:YidC/Oxa1 family membrane protein insertase
MSQPKSRKFLFAFFSTLAVSSIVAIVVLNGKPPAAPPKPVAAETSTSGTAAPAVTAESGPPSVEGGATAAPASAPATPPPAAAGRLVAKAPGEPAAPASLGSLDPTVAAFRLDFSPSSAGLERITFSNFWNTIAEAVAARRDPSALPPEAARYVLQTAQPLLERYPSPNDPAIEFERSFSIPVLGMHSVEIDGVAVSLFGTVWSSPEPGSFVTDLVDEAGEARFRVRREFRVDGPSYEITVRQRVENLTDRPAKVKWISYGPSDLPADKTSYIDVRRFHFGYLFPPERDPARKTIIATGQMWDRNAVSKRIISGDYSLWPNEQSREGQYTLSWFGATNRYFALTVHAPWLPPNSPDTAIGPVVESVRVRENGVAMPNASWLTFESQPNFIPVEERTPENLVLAELHSAVQEVPAGGLGAFDLGVYAGPLDSKLLASAEPYASLNLQQLIVYMLSSCCSFCTFAWLANFLVVFLTFLHDSVVFDWGIAIIVLVIVVRALLHPIMKRSQIQMQRFSKSMAELKPELDALQKRYRDEPTRMQQEQVRLYREKGINPAGCMGGMLPSFLQTPIWIALYAVLFFAFELRQSPAFFGLFQTFGGWTFLGDLSLPDNFLPFDRTYKVLFLSISGINLLPLLMSVVFYAQQKYLTPPTPNMSEEALAQQKMMKWMMVILFPLFLYSSPSGLTLYILTSTCIGIVEGKIVRRHIEKFGLDKPQKPGAKPAKKDLLGRIAEKVLERAQEDQRRKSMKSYKDRDRS